MQCNVGVLDVRHVSGVWSNEQAVQLEMAIPADRRDVVISWHYLVPV
jgi:hypothetical protein